MAQALVIPPPKDPKPKTGSGDPTKHGWPKLRLHLYVLHQPDMSIGAMLGHTQALFHSKKIDVHWNQTPVPLDLPDLRDLDIAPHVERGVLSAEMQQLFGHAAGITVGSGGEVTDIAVYFIRTTNPPHAGYAAHPPGIPSLVVCSTASSWTLAHEIGHVLGLHHGDDSGLMTSRGTHRISPLRMPALRRAEVETMSARISGSTVSSEEQLDTSCDYRMGNPYLGDGYALTSNGLGERVAMKPRDDSDDGQRWRLVALERDYYQLHSRRTGPDAGLEGSGPHGEVVDNRMEHRSSQAWQITQNKVEKRDSGDTVSYDLTTRHSESFGGEWLLEGGAPHAGARLTVSRDGQAQMWYLERLAEDDILAILSSDEPRYAATVESLSLATRSSPLRDIQSLAEGHDVRLAANAVQLLGTIGSAPDVTADVMSGVTASLAVAAANPDPRVRVAVVGAVSDWQPEAAEDVLERLSKDTDPGVQKLLARSVLKSGNPPWDRKEGPDTSIKLFAEIDYSGDELALGIGSHDLVVPRTHMNDRTVSVEIPQGVKVTLWSGRFDGRRLTLTRSAPDLGKETTDADIPPGPILGGMSGGASSLVVEQLAVPLTTNSYLVSGTAGPDGKFSAEHGLDGSQIVRIVGAVQYASGHWSTLDKTDAVDNRCWWDDAQVAMEMHAPTFANRPVQILILTRV